MQTITIDLDALAQAVDGARARQPEGPWRKRIDFAYEWLAEQTAVQVTDTGKMVVESATVEGLRYFVNGGCTCQAGRQGRQCWHRAAKQLVARMLEVQARQQAQQAQSLIERLQVRRRALAEVDELFP